MNGRAEGNAVDLKRGRTLTSVAEAPFLNSTGKVETLTLAALGRTPLPSERDRLVAYVESADPQGRETRPGGSVLGAAQHAVSSALITERRKYLMPFNRLPSRRSFLHGVAVGGFGLSRSAGSTCSPAPPPTIPSGSALVSCFWMTGGPQHH